MTDLEKERREYQRVFSQIRIPVSLSAEAIQEAGSGERKERSMKRRYQYAAALSAAAIIFLTAGTAYAADLGGIRTTVTMWLNGEQKELEAVPSGSGSWEFYEDGSDTPVKGGGGVWYDENGKEHPASAQDVADSIMTDTIEVEDGKAWLVNGKDRWDITEYFETGKTSWLRTADRYYKVWKDPDGGYSLTAGPTPESGRSYTELN